MNYTLAKYLNQNKDFEIYIVKTLSKQTFSQKISKIAHAQAYCLISFVTPFKRHLSAKVVDVLSK